MNRLEERVAEAKKAAREAESWAAGSGADLDDALLDGFLSALESQGLKIVPVEPTEAMVEAADARMRKWIPMPTHKGEYNDVLRDAYTAMLNAVEG